VERQVQEGLLERALTKTRRSLLIDSLLCSGFQLALNRFGKHQMKTLPSVYFLQMKERH
jgi:hypothetical protein